MRIKRILISDWLKWNSRPIRNTVRDKILKQLLVLRSPIGNVVRWNRRLTFFYSSTTINNTQQHLKLAHEENDERLQTESR
jgi:hypothetical protein